MTSGTAFALCSLEDSIFIGSDMNGHVGRDTYGYGGVHGGNGFGTRNAEGELILEFGDAVGMGVCKTFFKKEDCPHTQSLHSRPNTTYTSQLFPYIFPSHKLPYVAPQ